MIVCICNQTEGHTCIWHSVHGQFMTNFSEEQLLKEGVYDIKAVIMMMSMKHLQILLLYHLFFCCLNMIFLNQICCPQGIFSGICSLFVLNSNIYSTSLITFVYCTCMWKVIVKNPRPVLRILTDGLDQLIEIFTIS